MPGSEDPGQSGRKTSARLRYCSSLQRCTGRTGSLRCRDRLGPRLSGARRNAGELNPRAARLSHHKVHLGALARSFRRKLDHGAGPCRDTFVQGVKRVAVCNLQCKVMQTDIATAVKRHAFLRILDLPERHDAVSVRHERRRITLVLTNDSPAKAITKEAPCEPEVFHGKSDVIDADRQRGTILHS